MVPVALTEDGPVIRLFGPGGAGLRWQARLLALEVVVEVARGLLAHGLGLYAPDAGRGKFAAPRPESGLQLGGFLRVFGKQVVRFFGVLLEVEKIFPLVRAKVFPRTSTNRRLPEPSPVEGLMGFAFGFVRQIGKQVHSIELRIVGKTGQGLRRGCDIQ